MDIEKQHEISSLVLDVSKDFKLPINVRFEVPIVLGNILLRGNRIEKVVSVEFLEKHLGNNGENKKENYLKLCGALNNAMTQIGLRQVTHDKDVSFDKVRYKMYFQGENIR